MGPGGQPLPTLPMSDAPPAPLPMNPRMNPPAPKTSGQATQEALRAAPKMAESSGNAGVRVHDFTQNSARLQGSLVHGQAFWEVFQRAAEHRS